MHNRSIRQNTFNLPSMRRLWKTMGRFDALVEFNECAVRQFINKWIQYKEITPENTDFLMKEALEVGINLRDIDIDRYRQDLYRWYLVHPYGCIENFVKEFKEDLRVFGFNINLDFKDKSPLEKLILGMRESGISVSVEKFKLDLDTYYRRCRNLLVHKLDNGEKRSITSVYNKLQKDKIFNFYPSLTNALSAPCELTFEDYALCTANLKNIADMLTTDVLSGIKWDRFDIESLGLAKKLRKYNQNPERGVKCIKGYISSEYGVTVPDEVVANLQSKLTRSNNG